MYDKFEYYLIGIGAESRRFNFSEQDLYEGEDYFLSCYNNRVSPYFAPGGLKTYLMKQRRGSD